jgi:hypothetical protein
MSMCDKMAKSNVKYGVFALELVAALIFLAVAFTWAPNATTSTFAQVWQPLLYGAAVIGSIVTGFALVILTYGTPLPMIAALIGFIVGFAGSGMAHLSK